MTRAGRTMAGAIGGMAKRFAARQFKQECTGDIYSCECSTCQQGLVDLLADREYDDRRSK